MTRCAQLKLIAPDEKKATVGISTPSGSILRVESTTLVQWNRMRTQQVVARANNIDEPWLSYQLPCKLGSARETKNHKRALQGWIRIKNSVDKSFRFLTLERFFFIKKSKFFLHKYPKTSTFPPNFRRQVLILETHVINDHSVEISTMS